MDINYMRNLIKKCYKELVNNFGFSALYLESEYEKKREETDIEYYERLKRVLVNLLKFLNNGYICRRMNPDWIKQELSKLE